MADGGPSGSRSRQSSGGGTIDVAERHHAYELQIGAAHLGRYATVGDDENLTCTARQLDELPERGPL